MFSNLIQPRSTHLTVDSIRFETDSGEWVEITQKAMIDVAGHEAQVFSHEANGDALRAAIASPDACAFEIEMGGEKHRFDGMVTWYTTSDDGVAEFDMRLLGPL